MPSINMIAARRAEKKKLEERVRIALIFAIGSVAIALAILSFMTARVYSTGKAIDNVDMQLAKVQPIVDTISEYENNISKLTPKLVLLQESRQQTLVWYNALEDISKSMAEKTWITSLTTTSKSIPASGDTPASTAIVVNLHGNTISQSLVGETMLRLNQNVEFNKVDLDYTQKSSSAGVDLLEFAINIELKPLDNKKGGVSDNAGN
jgi:Tfp pilus assembly protein PilN